jgi:hypothetical protein
LHVAVATFWVGGFAAWALIVWPVLLRLPPERAAELVQMLGPRFGQVMGLAALTTLVLGILRGTVLGPIHALADLATPYGIMLAAMAVLLGCMVAMRFGL